MGKESSSSCTTKTHLQSRLSRQWGALHRSGCLYGLRLSMRNGCLVSPYLLFCVYTICWLRYKRLLKAKLPSSGHIIFPILPLSSLYLNYLILPSSLHFIFHILSSSSDSWAPWGDHQQKLSHGGCLEPSWRQTCAISAELAFHFLDTWWGPELSAWLPSWNTYSLAFSNMCPWHSSFTFVILMTFSAKRKSWRIMLINISTHLYPFFIHPWQAELTLWQMLTSLPCLLLSTRALDTVYCSGV